MTVDAGAANYEVARARPPVSMLPALAELFGVSVDEILGLLGIAPALEAAGVEPMSEEEIDAEVKAARAARRARGK